MIAFLPPLGIITGLLFYFGWTRSHFQAVDMGQSESIYGYSTTDYVLRSVDSLFFPLLVLTLGAIALILLHRQVVGLIREGRVGWIPVASRVLIIGGTVLAILGTVYALGWLTAPTPPGEMSRLFKAVFVGAPMAIGIGVLAAAYGGWLRTQVGPSRQGGDSWWHRVFFAGALTVFGALILFWAVGNYAQVRGFELAEDVLNNYRTFPGVSVHSASDLGLGDTVLTTGDTRAGAAYPYQYDCLRLLDHVSGVWYLMPDNWDDNSRLIILRDDPTMRFELLWPTEVPSCPAAGGGQSVPTAAGGQ